MIYNNLNNDEYINENIQSHIGWVLVSLIENTDNIELLKDINNKFIKVKDNNITSLRFQYKVKTIIY